MSWNWTEFVLVFAVLLAGLYTAGAQGGPGSPYIQEKRLMKPAHCPGQVISWPHRYRTLGARSVLECVATCRPDARCLSIVFDADAKKCYLGNDTSRPDCSNLEAGEKHMKYYETKVICEKHGEAPGPDGVCVCAEGFRGDLCTPYIGDCTEGYERGNFAQSGQSGVFLIHPLSAPAPFQVYCKKTNSRVRTYIMMRGKNGLSFDRYFADYKTGFGSLNNKDHWLGLEQIHQLTNSKRYELRIGAQFYENIGVNVFMLYQIFVVSDAASGYRLYANHTNNDTYMLGDCLAALYGAPFSAKDNDNDEDPAVNCAAKHGGGWWFRGSGCSTCNPTGPLRPPAADGVTRSGVDDEAFWKEDMGDLAMKKISMYLVVL